MKYLTLNDINCYKKALSLSTYVWNIVNAWKWFPMSTIGIQFVTAIDSISANVAEGFGRFNKKDKIKFYRYSQGSIKESLDWNEKSRIRNLVTAVEYKYILIELQKLPKDINQLIQYTNLKLKI